MIRFVGFHYAPDEQVARLGALEDGLQCLLLWEELYMGRVLVWVAGRDPGRVAAFEGLFADFCNCRYRGEAEIVLKNRQAIGPCGDVLQQNKAVGDIQPVQDSVNRY